ncbi:MAG: gliding motility-associated C-terminal domain-containing protein [Bacteroidales bacterium]|nr:gliding motility-associated C-terminal domain-containing protein [Bacteroidales bacterium]
MKNIKDILSAYEVEPSAGCWDKLSQRLDAAAAQASAGTSSSSAAGTSAGKGAALLHSVGAKIAATITGALIVGGVVTFVVLRPNSAETAQTDNTPSTTMTVADTSEENNAIPSTSNIGNTEPVVNKEKTDVQTNMPTSAADAEPVSTPDAPSTTTPAPSHPTPTTITAQPVLAPQAAKPSLSTNTTLGQVSLNQPSVLSQNMQDDPVLQNLSEDAIDWTPPTKVEIPNVFTPNGDGINDRFVIKGIENCEKRQLEMRNQAGNIVFQSSRYENDWAGDNCPDGTYRYRFIFSNRNISQTLTGTVTILRK